MADSSPPQLSLARFQLIFTAALAIACSSPIWPSLPLLSDPFGQTEEAVNATIWGLGARNMIELGPVAAKLGARVAPYPGAGGRWGIYAHHPPLPVWVSALVQLVFHEREAGPRLAAIACAVASLMFLYRALRYVAGAFDAFFALVAVATCPYVLLYGRLLTTVTLATPLFLLALNAALRRGIYGVPWRWTFPATLAALVLSSWDGVLGAVAIAAYVGWVERRDRVRLGGSRARELTPALVTGLALALVAAYLFWANGDLSSLVHQFEYRAGPAVGPGEWIRKQLGFLGQGLGWLSLAVLAGTALWWRFAERPRGFGVAFGLAVVPGLGMWLIFRQGADRHPFWAYNLILPAAFAFAGLSSATRRTAHRVLLCAAICAQMLFAIWPVATQLQQDRILNARGDLLRDWYGEHPTDQVRFLSGYNFFPFVSWYLRVPTDVVPTLDAMRERIASGRWHPEDVIVVDREIARGAGCAAFESLSESADARWALAPAARVLTACGGPSR